MAGTYYVHRQIYYYNFPLSPRVCKRQKKGNRELKAGDQLHHKVAVTRFTGG